jgi:hypothetical protein
MDKEKGIICRVCGCMRPKVIADDVLDEQKETISSPFKCKCEEI